jgi:hypothetical protein
LSSAHPTAIYSNDVSLYSAALGAALSGNAPPRCTVMDTAFEWLTPYLSGDAAEVSGAIQGLQNLLEFSRQRNAYEKRMFSVWLNGFAETAAKNTAELRALPWRINGFTWGDVEEHFCKYITDPDAVFLCFAPTYAGGYERIYKALDAVLLYDRPRYEKLDARRRAKLLALVKQHGHYLWIDDRELAGERVMAMIEVERRRNVYVYGDLDERVFLIRNFRQAQPINLPLAGDGLQLTPETRIKVEPVKGELAAVIKDVYLNKQIDHRRGDFPYVIYADAAIIGLLEYAFWNTRSNPLALYLQCDLAVSGTPYVRLSKLIVMLAISEEMRQELESRRERRVISVLTTAFTDRPVSMKYRGVLHLDKRGRTLDGKRFLNYSAPFNTLTYAETYKQWLMKYACKP